MRYQYLTTADDDTMGTLYYRVYRRKWSVGSERCTRGHAWISLLVQIQQLIYNVLVLRMYTPQQPFVHINLFIISNHHSFNQSDPY